MRLERQPDARERLISRGNLVDVTQKIGQKSRHLMLLYYTFVLDRYVCLMPMLKTDYSIHADADDERSTLIAKAAQWKG